MTSRMINSRLRCDLQFVAVTAVTIAFTEQILQARIRPVCAVQICTCQQHGKLISPEDKDASLRYVLGEQLVDAMTIGMLKTGEVDDTVARVNGVLAA